MEEIRLRAPVEVGEGISREMQIEETGSWWSAQKTHCLRSSDGNHHVQTKTHRISLSLSIHPPCRKTPRRVVSQRRERGRERKRASRLIYAFLVFDQKEKEKKREAKILPGRKEVDLRYVRIVFSSKKEISNWEISVVGEPNFTQSQRNRKIRNQ